MDSLLKKEDGTDQPFVAPNVSPRDEVPLHREEHRDGRQRREHGAGRHDVPGGRPLPFERGDADGDRCRVVALREAQCPEVVVPHEREHEDRERRERGPHERQHDAPVDRPLGRAFDARGLDQLERQLADEVAQEQRAEAGLERGVEQHERPHGVVQADAEHDLPHRNHQDLDRHEIAGDEQAEQHEIAAEPVVRERMPGERRQQDRRGDRRHRDQEAVREIMEHRRLRERGTVVVDERELLRPAPVIAGHDLVGRADRRDEHREQRHEPQRERARQRQPVQQAGGTSPAGHGHRVHVGGPCCGPYDSTRTSLRSCHTI